MTLTKDPRAAMFNSWRITLVSKHTTCQYKANLFDFKEWRDGRPISKTLFEEYASKLQAEGKAPNTINQRRAAIWWYARKIADLALNYGHDEELAKHASRVAIVEDVKGELSALIQACTSDPSQAGIRDAAIIALAWSTGLRRDEISRIELADLVNKTENSLDSAVVGKGGKVRVAYVNDGALAAILDWLELRGNEPGKLFVEVNKGGKIGTGQLLGAALRKMLDKRSREAQLSKPVTWHDFRRTFAGNLWDTRIDRNHSKAYGPCFTEPNRQV